MTGFMLFISCNRVWSSCKHDSHAFQTKCASAPQTRLGRLHVVTRLFLATTSVSLASSRPHVHWKSCPHPVAYLLQGPALSREHTGALERAQDLQARLRRWVLLHEATNKLHAFRVER